jgi:hypothetical protein
MYIRPSGASLNYEKLETVYEKVPVEEFCLLGYNAV